MFDGACDEVFDDGVLDEMLDGVFDGICAVALDTIFGEVVDGVLNGNGSNGSMKTLF